MLRVNLRVTVDLCEMSRMERGSCYIMLTGSTCDEETSLGSLRQTEHVQCSHEGSLDGLHSIELIMRRGCRACQVVDL